MDFFELINKRESCRSFDKSRGVSTELLKKCVQWAGLAPSACNSQPWSFIIVNRAEEASQVALSVQKGGFNSYAAQATAFIVVCKEKARLLAAFEAAGAESNHFRESDIGMALSYLTLAITENGLSSCIFGWRDDEMIKKALGLGDEKEIHCVVAVGYPLADEAPRAKKRKTTDQLMTVVE